MPAWLLMYSLSKPLVPNYPKSEKKRVYGSVWYSRMIRKIEALDHIGSYWIWWFQRMERHWDLDSNWKGPRPLLRIPSDVPKRPWLRSYLSKKTAKGWSLSTVYIARLYPSSLKIIKIEVFFFFFGEAVCFVWLVTFESFLAMQTW